MMLFLNILPRSQHFVCFFNLPWPSANRQLVCRDLRWDTISLKAHLCLLQCSILTDTGPYFLDEWTSALIFLRTKLFAHCSAVTTSMLKCPRKFKCLPQEDNFYQLLVTITLYGKIPLESFPEEQPCINTVTFLLEEGAFLFTVITRRFGQLIRKAASLSGQAVCGAV